MAGQLLLVFCALACAPVGALEVVHRLEGFDSLAGIFSDDALGLGRCGIRGFGPASIRARAMRFDGAFSTRVEERRREFACHL